MRTVHEGKIPHFADVWLFEDEIFMAGKPSIQSVYN
jgi:hypothetical protein